MELTYLFISTILLIIQLIYDVRSIDQNASELEEGQLERRILGIELGNIIKSASPCEVNNDKLECKFRFFIENPLSDYEGQVTIGNSESGLKASIRIIENERTINLNEALESGVDLPGLCVPVPEFPIVQFCLVFYDVRLNQNTGAHLCTSAEAQALDTTLAAVTFECLQVSPQRIDTAPPDNVRPSFIQAHVGQSPSITFFNKVNV